MSKGSKRRPCLVAAAEVDLRWKLAYGRITREEYENAKRKLSKMSMPKDKQG